MNIVSAMTARHQSARSAGLVNRARSLCRQYAIHCAAFSAVALFAAMAAGAHGTAAAAALSAISALAAAPDSAEGFSTRSNHPHS